MSPYDPFISLPRVRRRNRRKRRPSKVTLKDIIIFGAVIMFGAVAVSVFMFTYTVTDMAIKY